MTTGEMFFAVVFGVFGGFLGAVVAMSTMLRMDWPHPLDFEFRSDREKKRKMVVWLGAIWGFVIFFLLAALVNPADAQGLLDVDVDAKGAAEEVGKWDTTHILILAGTVSFGFLVWGVSRVAIDRNRLLMERRKNDAPPTANAPANCGVGHSTNGRDALWEKISDISSKVAEMPTRGDLKEVKADLVKALETHDENNAKDFKRVTDSMTDLEKRMTSLENRQPGDSQK